MICLLLNSKCRPQVYVRDTLASRGLIEYVKWAFRTLVSLFEFDQIGEKVLMNEGRSPGSIIDLVQGTVRIAHEKTRRIAGT